MGVLSYPQCTVVLRVRWEDFGDKTKESLQHVYELPILARSVTVNINDYTQADTFNVEIDYKSFPFDPRSIRACGVTIYMENVGRIYQDDNALEKLVPKRENAVFMGFADEESISFDDMKRTVRMEGRDFTSLLADRKYPHGTLSLEQPVDLVLKGILGSLKETQELKLLNLVTLNGGTMPILAKFWGEQNRMAGMHNSPADQSYWDLIQEIVSKAGLIAYIELDQLVLSTPRVLYDDKKAKVLVYGKNLLNLEYKRKIGRMKGFNVIVRSLSLRDKEVISAKIPAEATEDWSKATGIAAKENHLQTLKPDGTPVDVSKTGNSNQVAQPAPYFSFRVADVNDKLHLVRIGESIYEEMSRQQIEGSCETKDMEIPEWTRTESGKIVSREAFDILKLRVGTPVSIEIDQGDLKGISRLSSQAERVRFLLSRGYKQRVADAFAETIGKYKSIYYTRAVTFTMAADTGFKAKIEFVNFIQLPRALAGLYGPGF